MQIRSHKIDVAENSVKIDQQYDIELSVKARCTTDTSPAHDANSKANSWCTKQRKYSTLYIVTNPPLKAFKCIVAFDFERCSKRYAIVAFNSASKS